MKTLTKPFFLFVFLLSLTFSATYAQDDEILYYTPKKNEPFKSRNASIALMPLVIDVYDPNIQIGAGANAFFRIGRIGAVEASYNIAYFDRIGHPDFRMEYSEVVHAREGMTARNFEVTGRIYFYSKLKDVEEDILVDSEDQGRVTVNTMARIPSKRGVLYALRGGYIGGFSGQYSESTASFQYRGHRVDEPNAEPVDLSRTVNMQLGSQAEYGFLTAGLSRTRLKHIVVDVEGYGEKSNKSYIELYADFMYALKYQFDNIFIGENDGTAGYQTYEDYVEYDINDTEVNKIGGRIGVIYKPLDFWGLYIGGEAGIRPGVPQGLYLLGKAGINFAAKI